MTLVSQISFDGLLGRLFVCPALLQMIFLVLPDRVAGPGGWFIDTCTEEEARSRPGRDHRSTSRCGCCAPQGRKLSQLGPAGLP